MNAEKKLQEIRDYMASRIGKRFARKSSDEVYAEMRDMSLDDLADDISDFTDIIMDLREMLEVNG